MEKNYLPDRTGWLKRPLFCLLLACPVVGMADDAISQPIIQNVQETVQQKVTTRTIVGTIVDNADNSPIIGANIRIKDATTGVISDSEGHFSIEVPRGKETTLEISYIGYKAQTVFITDQGEVNIRLVSDNEILEEVVVVGAGTQKKVSVTGAITTIKGSDLRTPTSSLTNSIAGKLAGLISTTSSGEPGSTSGFYIRGISTFGGRTEPLILLDGVEISKGDLDRIPAENIEGFSLLKDASATAIYGARGANGVLLVTTKEGELNQKARINVNFEASLTQPMQLVDYVDGARWMEIYNEAAIARGGSALYTDDIELTRSHSYPYRYPDVDWQELMFKNSTWNERANVNISGGGSRITYYMSLQANHDTGMLDIPKVYSYDNNINRWNYIFQNNLTYNLTSSTKIGLKMNAQIGNLKGPGYSTSDLFGYAREVNPTAFPAIYPAREGDEHIRFGNEILSGDELYRNPYAEMLKSFKEENYNTLNTVLNVEQKLDFITQGLKVTALVNFKNWASTSYTRSIDPYYYRMVKSSWNPDNPNVYDMERLGDSGTDYVNEHDNGYSSNSTFYFDTRLDYNRTFAENHYVSGMLMYMQRENRSGVRPNRLQGFSGRFTYDYKHKYLAEFNFGYNGTERLAKDDRFEFFPAMSLGWVASGEDFWEPLQDYINHFKLRGSYGVVGSDDLDEGAGHYLYVDNVILSGGGYHTGYDGQYEHNGPGFNSFAVEDACWERANKLNIGVDMELFNQLSITFDWFYDHRHRILMRRGSWPTLTGYFGTTPWSNIGEVDNKGVELSVNWRKELMKDLYIDMRGNFTYNKNKFVYYDEPNYEASWKKKTGQPLSNTWGYIAEGYFTDEQEVTSWADQSGLGSQPKPGDIKYRDVNGDGVISDDDMVMLSPFGSMPRIQYGLGLNLTYKKFDFGVFFNGSAQRKIMINGAMTPFGERNNNVMAWIADNHWSEQNRSAEFPRLGLTNSDIANNNQSSSHWMRNGNFIRFKTLELGYSFPHCRLYFSGDNLAVWSPFKYWDPELNWNTYPLQRTFNLGVQVNF